MINDLPDLPGINLVDGLQRINGNWTAYKRILLRFRRVQIGAADEISACINQNKMIDAAHLVHSLKGSSGNIGAEKLFQQAAVLEQVCRTGSREQALSIMEDLRSALSGVMNGLLILDNERAISTDHSDSLSMDGLRAEIETIESYLKSDIAEAKCRIESLVSKKLDDEVRLLVGLLLESVDMFDINQSVEIVNKLRTVCYV